MEHFPAPAGVMLGMFRARQFRVKERKIALRTVRLQAKLLPDFAKNTAGAYKSKRKNGEPQCFEFREYPAETKDLAGEPNFVGHRLPSF